MPPLLSICIPTFNRVTLLTQGLGSIIDQLSEIDARQVEIVISDNASIDGTEELVRSLKITYPRLLLTYFRHTTNVGAAANVCSVAALAQGDFVYIVSDDDILLPGAIARILLELQMRPMLDAVCPNICTFRESPAEVGSTVFSLDKDRLVFSRDEALESLGTFLTFISCLVIRRERIEGQDYTSKIASDLPHAYMFLDAVRHEGGCLMLKQPCLAMRANDSVGYNVFEVFVTNFCELIEHAKSLGISQLTAQRVLQKHLDFVAGVVQTFKERGSYRPSPRHLLSDLSRLLRVYPWRSPRVIRVIGLMLLPLTLISLGRRAYRLVATLR